MKYTDEQLKQALAKMLPDERQALRPGWRRKETVTDIDDVVKQWPLRSCPTAPCPRCGQSVRGALGAINSCRCGALLRRYDTGEWGVMANEKLCDGAEKKL